MVKRAALALALFPGVAFGQTLSDVETGDITGETAPLIDAPIAHLTARLAYNTENGPVVGLGVATDRLFGLDQQLRFGFEAQRDARRINLSYNNDALFGTNPSVGMNVFFGETAANGTYGFSSQVGRIEPRVSYDFGSGLVASAYFTAAKESIDGVSATTSLLIQNDAGSQTSRAVGLEMSYALPVQEDSGLRSARLAFGAAVGETSRSHSYVEVTARASALYVAYDGNVVLRGAVSAGAINTTGGVSNIGDRFMLGQGSIRGFAFGGFGPRDLAVADTPALGGNYYGSGRFDVLFPHALGEQGRNLTPGVFVDVASLWGLDDTAGGIAGGDVVDDASYLRASVGLSLRIATPIGPIEVYVARPVQQQTYDVTQTFGLAFTQSF